MREEHENPGYHVRKIKRGVMGEASKILEEAEEFIDANEQRCKIMELVELSDILGAIEAYLAKSYPSINITDLFCMNEITKRAFHNGHRH
jgi:phosphoribosyl-ATP pyrophosphohydrolase